MITCIPETSSTNADVAAALADGGWAEGRWLVAERQTRGRGRLGREWHDGAGNFMGSTVVNLGTDDLPAPSLALVAGMAVHATVSSHIPPPAHAMLKWPNDLLIGNAKVAGILLERVKDMVVVGIGVNLASAPALDDRPTAALGNFVPVPVLPEFADRLSRQFAAELARWRHEPLAALIARWEAAAHPIGTPLVADGNQGTFAGLDSTGALLLTLADGTVHSVHAGDVELGGADAARH